LISVSVLVWRHRNNLNGNSLSSLTNYKEDIICRLTIMNVQRVAICSNYFSQYLKGRLKNVPDAESLQQSVLLVRVVALFSKGQAFIRPITGVRNINHARRLKVHLHLDQDENL
jgi:hypothetical protein